MVSPTSANDVAGPGQNPAEPGQTDPTMSWALAARTPRRDVPYLPTDQSVVEAMLDFAHVGSGDVLYDLGCGDGRIVVSAAKRGARAVGVEVDPMRLRECHDNAARAGLARRVTFVKQSFFDVDLRDATVVTLYLLPGVNIKLRPKLLWELRPGSRVVSNNFDMKDWPADAQMSYQFRALQKWIVPAWVAGRWRCFTQRGQRPQQQQRQRMWLELRRRFQFLSGTAHFGGGRQVAISDGRIVGDRINFTLWHPEHARPAVCFTGRIGEDGRTLRGRCQCIAGGPPWEWGGIRESGPSPSPCGRGLG